MNIAHVLAAKTDQLNSDDLVTGPRTIRIRDIRVLEKGSEQPLWIYFDGDDNKPWKACKSMARIMYAIWKEPENWIGRRVTLFRDPNVSFGAEKNIGGIRIACMDGINEKTTVMITATRGKKKPYTVKPLKDAPAEPAERSVAGEGAASVADAASLMEEIDRCETEKELGKWKDQNKARWSKLEGAQFEMFKAAYQRRKGELAEGAAS